MSVLDMMAEEIEEIGGPAIAADAPVGDSTDSDSRRNRLSGQPHNPPLYELIHVRAFDWMEYVEDSQCGCIYHTEGYLWECMNTSDSRKWYAVVRGTSLGVFRQPVCPISNID